MTIERQWFEVMKTEVPDAFQDQLADADKEEPKAAFIDGQIKLMGMVSENEWEPYLLKQFVQPLISFMEMNADVIVLAFDDYEYVPRAKFMTQAKRRKNLDPYAYTPESSFPLSPPVPWDAAMCNRQFKAAVIGWIIDELRGKLIIPFGVSVIVDWKGESCLHWTTMNNVIVETHLTRTKTGEADIKFLQWCKKLQKPMVVEAIDGDFVPIALAVEVPKVFIRRYKVLRAEGEPMSFEWVNIDLLRIGMRRALQQMSGRQKTFWPGWELHCLLAMIGVTGTDFTRGLPWIGPKKVWTMMPSILPVLADNCITLDHGIMQMEPDATARELYGVIYANSFRSHVHSSSFSFTHVLQQLANSKLSGSTKSKLPSFERAVCSAKNINFLLSYWHDQNPDSLCGSFGYREQGGSVEWDD